MTAAVPVVTVVVVAYGETPLLSSCISSVLNSQGLHARVIVVDNGSTDASLARVPASPDVVVVSPGCNLGFAAGCNLGAAHAKDGTIVFLNPDAIVDRSALAILNEALNDGRVGIVMPKLRLFDEPDLLNSSGTSMHFLGLGWANGFRLAADRVATRGSVAGASGAAMAISTRLFRELGGFTEPLFLYHEDLELSLRVWLRGLRVEIVPEANVWHKYEFARNSEKLYYLERNRLILISTIYETRTLLLLAPCLVVYELGIVALAAIQRWLPEKVKGWRWLIQNRTWVWRHREKIQSQRVIRDYELAALITNRFNAGQVGLPSALKPVDWALGQYWVFARELLGRSKHSRGTPNGGP